MAVPTTSLKATTWQRTSRKAVLVGQSWAAAKIACQPARKIEHSSQSESRTKARDGVRAA